MDCDNAIDTGWGQTSESSDSMSVQTGWPALSAPTAGTAQGWEASPQVVTVGNWSRGSSASQAQHTSHDADMEDDADCPEKYTEDPSKLYAVQMSPEAYRKQGDEYTKSAVAALLKSPEYRRKYTTCRMCWSIWAEGMYSDSCRECGGYAMRRPCPICHGKCGKTWTREVELSHDNNKAFWDGECGLPFEERQAFMMQTMMEDATEESVLEALQQLAT